MRRQIAHLPTTCPISGCLWRGLYKDYLQVKTELTQHCLNSQIVNHSTLLKFIFTMNTNIFGEGVFTVVIVFGYRCG